MDARTSRTDERADDERAGGLLAWQWRLYPDGHRDRRNLRVHAITNPLFLIGTCLLPLGFLLGPWWLTLVGADAMVFAIVLQGRFHRVEQTRPAPFRGPLDVVARLLCEQWVTFPRYVLSGRFGAAWRASAPPSS